MVRIDQCGVLWSDITRRNDVALLINCINAGLISGIVLISLLRHQSTALVESKSMAGLAFKPTRSRREPWTVRLTRILPQAPRLSAVARCRLFAMVLNLQLFLDDDDRNNKGFIFSLKCL